MCLLKILCDSCHCKDHCVSICVIQYFSSPPHHHLLFLLLWRASITKFMIFLSSLVFTFTIKVKQKRNLYVFYFYISFHIFISTFFFLLFSFLLVFSNKKNLFLSIYLLFFFTKTVLLKTLVKKETPFLHHELIIQSHDKIIKYQETQVNFIRNKKKNTELFCDTSPAPWQWMMETLITDGEETWVNSLSGFLARNK